MSISDNTLRDLEGITGSALSLGGLLRAIRQGEAMTQVEFAAALGMSKQQLCDIEHQRKYISPKLAASYAKKLGYSTEQFIRLSLQDLVDRDGLGVVVDIVPKKKAGNNAPSHAGKQAAG